MQNLHFLYHELRPTRSDYSYVVGCEQFERHLDLFTSIQPSSGSLLPQITFDDGHVSNHKYALPLLLSRGLQAHFFITVGWTGKKPDYMGWDDLRDLQRSGQIIGAHGWTHTLLTHCNPESLRLELQGAREELEDKLGTSVNTMSLPGGRFSASVLKACKDAGYAQIYTSIPRAEPAMTGPLVGRLNVRGDMQLSMIETLLDPKGALLPKLERQYRIKQAVQSLLGDRAYAKIWAILNRHEPEAQAS